MIDDAAKRALWHGNGYLDRINMAQWFQLILLGLILWRVW